MSQLDLFSALGMSIENGQTEALPAPAAELQAPPPIAIESVSLDAVLGQIRSAAIGFGDIGAVEVDDFVQEGLIRVWLRRPRFIGAAINFSKQSMTDCYRKEQRRHHLNLDIFEDSIGLSDAGGLDVVEDVLDGFPGLTPEQARAWVELLQC